MPPSSVADQHPEREGPPLSTWEFVPVSDYAPPPPGVVETTKRSINILWRRLHPEKKEPVPYVKPEDQLTRLPPWQLQRAAPRPDWTEAAEALDAALGDWVTDAPSDQPVRPVVTPPHVDRSAILAAWAEQHQWRTLTPPSPEQILSGGDDWLAEQFGPDEDGAPWVLPDLERLYLRHTAGLALISAFLDRAHTGTLGPGLIGCDSWAWAFLDHVWRGWMPPSLTLQAYDEDRLTVFFRQLARTAGDRGLSFRQSDDGSDVLPPPDAPVTADHQSDFLHHLATYSRGNLGVAWAIWRSALGSEPVEDAPDEADAEERISGRTIWVTPWVEVPRPTLSSEADHHTAFVIHALLLHGGLPAPTLRCLLPTPAGRITEILDGLRVAGLAAVDEGRWRVTAIGYPPVREFLRGNGYLTDAF